MKLSVHIDFMFRTALKKASPKRLLKQILKKAFWGEIFLKNEILLPRLLAPRIDKNNVQIATE